MGVSFDLLTMHLKSFHSSILHCLLFANYLTSALPNQSRVTLCEFTINGLVDVLSNSPSLEEQAAYLLPICDQLTDEAALKKCRREVDAYWNYLAPPLYDTYIGGSVETICDIQLPTEDECFRCQQRVGLVAELVTSEEVVAGMVGMVQGELFCNMEGHWWDVEQCQAEWAWFLPQAMSAIGNYLSGEDWQWSFCEGTAGVCHS